MSEGTSRRGGKKNRKHSRNKVSCAIYKSDGRRGKNKAKKIARHIKKHPSDEQAKKAANS